MTPQLKKLQELDHHNSAQLGKFDRMLLSYARAEGLLDDNDFQRQVSKALLDDLILELEPEDWAAFNEITPVLGERHTRELMRYSLERSLLDVQEKRQEIERLMDEPDDDDDAVPSGKPEKDRDY